MRRAPAILAVVALLGALAPAASAGRLDRAAAALRGASVFVDPDLAWMVGRDEQAAIAQVLARSPVAFKVAVLPSLLEDESGGQTARVLAGLWQRLRIPAVYVTFDQNGFFDLDSPGVARDISVPLSMAIPDPQDNPRATILSRMRTLERIVADSPPGTASGPRRIDAKLEPVFTSPSETTWWQELIAGALLGLLAFGVLRFLGPRLIGRRSRRA